MATIERILAQAVTAVYGFKHSEKGQGMAEYGLILALVAVVVITALTTLGTGISGTFNTIASKI